MEELEKRAFLVREGLAQRGISVDDVDIAVIGAIEQTYGPGLDALMAADLSDVVPERDFDPGRAPSRLVEREA